MTGCCSILLWLAGQLQRQAESLMKVYCKQLVAGCACPIGPFWESGDVEHLHTTTHWPKTNIICCYNIRKGCMKLPGRFGLFFSIVKCRNRRLHNQSFFNKRCGRLKIIQENHRPRMVRRVTEKPQTTCSELQEHLAAEGVVDYSSIM